MAYRTLIQFRIANKENKFIINEIMQMKNPKSSKERNNGYFDAEESTLKECRDQFRRLIKYFKKNNEVWEAWIKWTDIEFLVDGNVKENKYYIGVEI